LHIAAVRGQLAKVKALVLGGADVNQVIEEDCSTPLLIAASKSKVDLVEYLLDKQANINAQLKDGATALYLAAESGADSLARLLLVRGGDATIENAVCHTMPTEMVRAIIVTH
jgi:ankyrin repeat protein